MSNNIGTVTNMINNNNNELNASSKTFSQLTSEDFNNNFNDLIEHNQDKNVITFKPQPADNNVLNGDLLDVFENSLDELSYLRWGNNSIDLKFLCRRHFPDGCVRKNYEHVKYEISPFKLHCSLNDIEHVKGENVIKLIQKLNDEIPRLFPHSFFKVIKPEKSREDRFKNNDQFTIYISTANTLSQINNFIDIFSTFIKEDLGVEDNQIDLGPKDLISFNSFFSGRFDTFPYAGVYGEFPFLDREFEKFIATLNDNGETSSDFPMLALHAVFINCVLRDDITLKKETLDEKDSLTVQNEFKIMNNDYETYLKGLFIPSELREKLITLLQEYEMEDVCDKYLGFRQQTVNDEEEDSENEAMNLIKDVSKEKAENPYDFFSSSTPSNNNSQTDESKSEISPS